MLILASVPVPSPSVDSYKVDREYVVTELSSFLMAIDGHKGLFAFIFVVVLALGVLAGAIFASGGR